MQVSPAELRAAAAELGKLGESLPVSGAKTAADALPGTATGAALAAAAAAEKQAGTVLRGRFVAMRDLFVECANTFQNTDEDAARRLAALGDLNGASA